MARTQPLLHLFPTDAAGPWGSAMLSNATEGFKIAQRRLGLTLSETIHIRSFATEAAFRNYLGSAPTNVLAVARLHLREIVVLRPAWSSTPANGRREVFIHEATHLILGLRAQGPLPRWLNEGMAMIVAREIHFRRSWILTLSGVLGNLLKLGQLQEGLLFNGATQQLAYAQSLSVTQFFLKRALLHQPNPSGDPAALAQALADPQRGPMLIRRLWNPQFIKALDRSWRQSEGSLWSWFAVLSGASTLWMMTSMLFLLAYWRKRRFARQIRERFETEEALDAELGLEPPPWEYGAGDEDP
jgi:hypothetical protein